MIVHDEPLSYEVIPFSLNVTFYNTILVSFAGRK
jgi:hypothetical protein